VRTIWEFKWPRGDLNGSAQFGRNIERLNSKVGFGSLIHIWVFSTL